MRKAARSKNDRMLSQAKVLWVFSTLLGVALLVAAGLSDRAEAADVLISPASAFVVVSSAAVVGRYLVLRRRAELEEPPGQRPREGE